MTATLKSQSSESSLSDLKLKHILKTLPKDCFQKNRVRAWTTIALSLSMASLGYLGIAYLPWFFLPLTWIFTGTALTGFFVIGHDCGHRSFAQRRWVNDLVGHLFMMPLIYPFHSWRILHNKHHKHTNKMEVDNAWHPMRPETYDSLDWFTQKGYQALRGRFWWVASIVHWVGLHFNLKQFEAKDHGKVKLSIAVAVLFAAIAFPLLIINVGVWGFVKFWLMPWLVYHFWMSTFTLVHHTAPDIEFRSVEEWHEAKAQLSGTVHCKYPAWVELLCHDINVHIPHHLSTAIPSYNLRKAHKSLKQNWGPYLYESKFSWKLMKDITDQCHLYHPDNCYESFRAHHAKRAG